MGIAKAAFIIMLGNIASRLLGVVREQVIAGLFGLTDAADIFSVASRVTTPIYDLLIGGMISAALIPVFSDYADRKEHQSELWLIASVILNLIFIMFAAAVALLVVLAPLLMQVYGYGFDVEKQVAAVGLVRVMLTALILMGISGVFTALLYSRRRFGLPALIGAAYNSGIIVVALLLHKQMGVGSLALGIVIGGILQVVVLLPGLKGMRYSLKLSIRHPAVRRIIILYIPVALGLVVSAVGITIDSNLASRTGEGNMAAMRYATTLIQFPLGVVATATSFAVLPTLSRYAATMLGQRTALTEEPLASVTAPEPAVGAQPTLLTDHPDADFSGIPKGRDSIGAEETVSSAQDDALAAYKETLALGLKMMLLMTLPATVGLALLRVPVIQLLFQHGVFGVEDTARTALAFLCYSPGLPAAAVDQLLIYAFYARKNTVTPVVVGVLAVLVYLGVGVSLLKPLGMPGLAIANSAQWIFHALVMLFLMSRTVAGLKGLGIGVLTCKVLAASALMGAVLFFIVDPILGDLVSIERVQGCLYYLAIATISGFTVYIAAIVVLRVQEVNTIWSTIKESRH